MDSETGDSAEKIGIEVASRFALFGRAGLNKLVIHGSPFRT